MQTSLSKHIYRNALPEQLGNSIGFHKIFRIYTAQSSNETCL